MWFGMAPKTDKKKKHVLEMCAQNIITIIGSRVNIIVGTLYDHLMSTRVFTLIMSKIFI